MTLSHLHHLSFRQLVLKWAAQRRVCNIREEWDNSKLISSDVEIMTGQLTQARQAHTFAVTTAGADEVTASCEAILAHLGRVVEAVGFLQNRNLTGAYWERVDQTMPLREVSGWCHQLTDGKGLRRLVARYERKNNGAHSDIVGTSKYSYAASSLTAYRRS